MTPFLLLNIATSVVTVAFGLTGAVRPASMTGSAPSTSGEHYFAYMYASRAIPLGILAAIAPFVLSSRASALVLFAAALAQLGDVVIGVWRSKRPMIFGGGSAAVIYAVTATLLF